MAIDNFGSAATESFTRRLRRSTQIF